MIEYHRLEGDGQRNVILTTDDSAAEMLSLEELIDECGLDIELPTKREQDNKFHVTIPGELVGEFSDVVYDVDGGKLANLIEKWNHEMLSELYDDE